MVTDPDDDRLQGLEVAIRNPSAGDRLDADVRGTGIRMERQDGALFFRGRSSLARYERVLRSVTYENSRY